MNRLEIAEKRVLDKAKCLGLSAQIHRPDEIPTFVFNSGRFCVGIAEAHAWLDGYQHGLEAATTCKP